MVPRLVMLRLSQPWEKRPGLGGWWAGAGQDQRNEIDDGRFDGFGTSDPTARDVTAPLRRRRRLPKVDI
jgi:hypothetical protein